MNLQVLQEEWQECTRCILHESRIKCVFGRGTESSPKVLFLGHSPGNEENKLGTPFIGRSGKLLDKMIEAMGLQSSDYYIMNPVLCHPPDNRAPSSEELAACAPRMEQQIDLVQPKVIIGLGSVAGQALGLLRPGESLGSKRKKQFIYRNIPTWLIFHPSYLLRDPSKKEEAAQDLGIILSSLI